jgi:hypothetical protein
VTPDEINLRFDHHPPDALKVEYHVRVRAAYKTLAVAISNLPNSREKALAYTSLEESLMWSNAAIARNEVNE